MSDGVLKEFINMLSDLVSFKSLSINEGECEKTAKYLVEVLKEVGFSVKAVKPREGNPVILASLKGKDNNSILFYNHYDVQPAEPLEEWIYDPFQVKVVEDRIYGRGVGDNKGNIVSRILAVKKILEEEGELPIGVKFVIEGGEEAGSPHLWDALSQSKEFFEDVELVIWEFGGFNKDGSMTIFLGLKGILYFELKARRLSRDAHSSLAVLLPSAAWDLIKFLYELKKDNLKKIKSFWENIVDVRKVLQEIKEAGYEIAFEPDVLKQEFGIESFVDNLEGEKALEAYYGKPSFNIDGFLTGYTGKALKTVLPAEASVKVDFRLVPYQDAEAISKEFCELAEKNGLICKKMDYTEPTYTSFKHPSIQKLLKILNSIGVKTKIAPWSPGSGPMHIFTKYLKLPAVSGIGVSYWGTRAHAPNENIRIKDVEKTIQIISETIKSHPRMN